MLDFFDKLSGAFSKNAPLFIRKSPKFAVFPPHRQT